MALVIMLGMNAQVNAQVKDVHSKAYEAEKVNGDWLAWLGARTISSNGTTVYYTGGVEIEKYFVPDGQPLEQEDGCKQAMQQATRYLANVIRSNKGLWEGLEAYKDRAYKIKMLDVTIAELLVRAGKKVDPKEDAQKAADKAAYEAAQKREVEKKQAAEAAQQAAKAAASTRKKTPADTKEEQQIKSKNYLLDNLEDQYKPERMTDRARVILCVRGAVSEVLGANRHEKTVTTSAKWMPVQLTTPQLKKYGKADAALCVVAQNDLIEPGEMADFDRVMEGLKEGIVTRSHLERNARNILTLLLRTHVYTDQPYAKSVQGTCITFR